MNLFTKHLSRIALVMLLVILCTDVFAQNKAITGVVIDASGAPIVGANVTVKHNRQVRGTATDLNGAFTLSAPQNSTLVISFLGYVTYEIVASGNEKLKIVLKDDATSIDDVVVVGFGTQKKESVVGAISTVKASELVVPVRSLSNSIGGRVAGIISVQRSGEPGKDDAQFWIRGISTFTGNRNPLILVDGIERPMNNVDPLEIESFSVLKDASATAVYGVRGANGVVLINTKKGVDGPAKIDVRYEHGFSYATKRPSYLSAYERSMLYNEAIDANPGASQAMKYQQHELDAMQDGSDPELYPNVDWQSVLMRDITMNEKLSVNISGGGKTARYFAAVSIYNQDGQYDIRPGNYNWVPSQIGKYGKNVNYNRYNFRSNIDMDLTKYTTVSLGIQGNISNNTEPPKGSSEIYMWINNVAPNAFPVLYKDGKFPARDGLYNPYVQLTQMGYKQTTTNEIRSNLTLNQDFSFITKGLKATVRYAYDAVNYNDAKRERDVMYHEAIRRDDAGNLEYKTTNAANHKDYLSYSSTAWGNKNQYIEASLNYDNAFGRHEVSGLVLYYMKDYRNNTAGNYVQSLPNRSLGLAARATYAYDSKYLLEANIGYNGSENFPRGQRMGFFPSMAAGWVASAENFLKNNKTITWLKIRGSVGQVGSDQIGSERFAYLSTLEDAGGYSNFGEKFDQSSGGLQEAQMAAQNITWEIATKYNLGLELGLFNNLKINADVFYEKRENIFLQPQTTTVAGLQKPMWANMGVMDNRGFEITGEYNKIMGDFILTGRGNFTFARNKIIDDGKAYLNPWQDVRGTRYGERLMYDAMHLFSQEEINALPDYYRQFSRTKEQLRPGDIRYRDVNDDGRITEDDMIFTSNPSNPEMLYGFGASLNYKNFDFSFLMQGAIGGTSYLSAGWYFYPFQAERDPKLMGNLISKFSDRWTEQNPNPHAFAPRLYMGNDVNNYKTSTWWVRDCNYLRLKNIELGYTLPKRWMQKARIQNARIYVSGVNLYTFSKFAKDFWDPEVGADAYPIQATIFFGINLTF